MASPVKFTIGQTTADVAYAGLVQDLVGLYQFNVVVPSNAPNGDLALNVGIGTGTLKDPQTLYLSVQAPSN